MRKESTNNLDQQTSSDNNRRLRPGRGERTRNRLCMRLSMITGMITRRTQRTSSHSCSSGSVALFPFSRFASFFSHSVEIEATFSIVIVELHQGKMRTHKANQVSTSVSCVNKCYARGWLVRCTNLNPKPNPDRQCTVTKLVTKAPE